MPRKAILTMNDVLGIILVVNRFNYNNIFS